MNFSDRSKIEGQLRAELRQARERYESATRQFDIATAQAHELGLTNPDGSHAMHKAAAAYNHALRGYCEALKRFSSFILDGLPSE